MDFRDIAFTSLRSIRAAAVDLLTIIRNRRLDRGDTYPQSYKASDSQIKVMDALGVLAKALYELPSGFLAYERVLPPEMTEEEAEALIQRHLDNPNKYGGKLTPEEERRTTAAWIESVRHGTKPIPDARPMLVGEEFLDADEAHKLLYAVHSALCSAGWLRCDIRPAPVKVEAAVVEKLERGIELLSRFEEQAGGAAVDDQAGGKPAAVEDRSKHPWGDDDPDALFRPAKLADRLGIPADDERTREALRQRLIAWRKANLDGGWQEVRDPKPRQPKYLYPIGKAWGLVEDLRPSG